MLPKEERKKERCVFLFQAPSSLVVAAKRAGAGSSEVRRGIQRLWGQDISRPPVLCRRSRDRESQGKKGRVRREGGGRQADAFSSSGAQASRPQLLFLEAAAAGAGSRKK